MSSSPAVSSKFLNFLLKEINLANSYQELPKGDENSRIINPRFSREVFDHISKSFHLSPEYLELHQARHVPLVINLPSTENKYTSKKIPRMKLKSLKILLAMVLQSATNTLSSSINLSHDSQTGTTQGFFIFNGSRYKQEVIKVLRTVKLDAAHPLLLPTIFLRFWQPVCNQDNAAQSKWMRSAKAITKDVFDPAQASLLQSRITEARKLIFDTHMSAHSPMADFMLNFSANLAQAFNSVPMMVSTMTMRNIMRTHLDFRAMVMAWKCIIDAELEQKVKKTEEIKMEIGVVRVIRAPKI